MTRGAGRTGLAIVGVILTAAVLGAIVLVWGTTLPLGVPGEWTWNRSPVAADFGLSLLPALLWGAGFAALIWWGAGRLDSTSRVGRASWLLALFGGTFGLLGALQEAAPPEFRAAKIAWVLYYPGASGYFTEARQIDNTARFLADYLAEVRQGDVLHQGTHPPGLIVGYRGLMWVCRQSPQLRSMLIATMPADLKDAFDVIAQASRSTPTPLTDHDRCVIWLAALVMQACAAATVLPLYGLLRLHCGRSTSWSLASLWPVVPAVAIFLPKSDACFPFLGCLVVYLWLTGLRSGSLGQTILWRTTLAGGLFWLGMTLSLVMLPIAFFAGGLTLWYLWRATDSNWLVARRRLWLALLTGGLAFCLPTWVLARVWHCPLPEIWLWNYRNHAGFYAQYPRTWWKWLLVNPLELAMAAGPPLTLLFLAALVIAARHGRRTLAGPLWTALLTWSILWMTGKNMGEAARLWIFLMPWMIWGAGSAICPAEPARPGDHERPLELDAIRRCWLLLWSLQFLAALGLITRVAGFSLA